MAYFATIDVSWELGRIKQKRMNLSTPAKFDYKVLSKPAKSGWQWGLYEVEMTDRESGNSYKAYLTRLNFQSLELGDKLAKKLSYEELRELESFIEDYGFDRYNDGFADGEDR